LILCEHPPIITVGRQGSRNHVLLDDDELRAMGLEVRWTNRGGGCWLQAPGQLAAYPIIPLDPDRFGLERHRSALYGTLIDVLREFGVFASRDEERSGVVVDGRQIAGVGVAVKDWVAYHGCWLNVAAPPDRFNCVQVNPLAPERAVTSMFRELRLPVRPSSVRESFVRHFVARFGFRDYFLVDAPPTCRSKRRAHVVSPDH
jgi:lipoyl(octanoyl) transferase